MPDDEAKWEGGRGGPRMNMVPRKLYDEAIEKINLLKVMNREGVQALAEVEDLRRQLREMDHWRNEANRLLRDESRMNWLDSQGPDEIEGGSEGRWLIVSRTGSAIEHDDLRVVVDEAMKEESRAYTNAR